MASTFYGLETARRALNTQQAALLTTGHNVANANTPGYTRQRVNLTTTEAFPSAGINRAQIAGQLGTGVQVGDVQRIRDSFIDTQYRSETSKLGYWQAKAEQLAQMEDIMNEPSDSGLADTLDGFWSSLQDLASQPQNSGARRVVRQRGIALVDTFSYINSSLQSVQKNYRNEIDISEQNVNSILRQINQVNEQIGSVEPHGYLPNDLYDERDRLVDELSTMANVKIEVKPSGGLPSSNAEGQYNVYLANSQGEILKDSNNKAIKLVDSEIGTATGFHIQYENRLKLDSPVTEIKFFQLKDNETGFVGLTQIEADKSDSPTYQIDDVSQLNTNGKLRGYIEGYGYKSNVDGVETDVGLYNEMLAELDVMAYIFANQFNVVHQSGWSPNEIQAEKESKQSFFSFDGTGTMPTEDNPKGAAARIKVSAAILEDEDNIAAAAEANVLSGAMVRENVQNGTSGNPAITGIYDKGSALEENEDFANAEKMNITLTYDSGLWTYTMTGLDRNGDELDPAVTDFGSITIPETSATVFGVEIDISQVETPQDGDTWSYEFKAEGIKSKDEAFIGNGTNALKLAEVKDAVLNFGGSLTDVQSFYQGLIGTLGDKASEANRMTEVAGVLKDSVEQNRLSISSVSLDEEMTEMIKFQHAYNAAARNITLIDEMLDKIINGMGLGGR